MSLPGSRGSQYGPERSDLILQLRHASAVVQHHISGHPAIFAARLGGNPGLGLGPTEPITLHQPLDLGLATDIDSDDKIELPLLTGLHEQGNDMDDDCARTGRLLQLLGSRPDRRVHNLLEISTRNRISENDVSQTCPIELLVIKNPGTESLDDRSQPWSAGLDDLTGQYVGVDDDCTTRRKLGCHQAFPRRNTARETYPHNLIALLALLARRGSRFSAAAFLAHSQPAVMPSTDDVQELAARSLVQDSGARSDLRSRPRMLARHPQLAPVSF